MFYKVVFVSSNGDLVSALAFFNAEVTYYPNKWVRAPKHLAEAGYHLLVFDDLQSAREFSSDPGVQLWECECRYEITPLPAKRDYGLVSIHGIFDDPLDEKDDTWPAGTRMFKEVKLTRRIK